MSEFLRKKKRGNDIAEQQNRDEHCDSGDKVKLHELPQLLAGPDVEKRHGKESRREYQHEEILHNDFQILLAKLRGSRPPTKLILKVKRFSCRKDFLNNS
jgi:hypothetical protein